MRALPSKEQDLFQTALRWMEENIIVAGGVYRDGSNRLRIAREIRLDRQAQVKPWSWNKPSGWKSGMLNSTVALTCCCYIAALGKVASRGDKNRCDRAVFASFIDGYMNDLLQDSKNQEATFRPLQLPAKHTVHSLRGKRKCLYTGGNVGTEVLYRVYRNGFVHAFWPKGGALVRRGVENPFWCPSMKHPERGPQLNIDRLAWELLKGIKRLRHEYQLRAEAAPDAYRNFVTWLTEK